MLVLTTNALEAGAKASSLPSWPGLRVLIVLPGSDCDHRALAEADEGLVVAEWLQPPQSTTAMLADVIRWLEGRLSEDEGPFQYIDHPLDPDVEMDDPSQVSPFTVDAKFDPDGKIQTLVLGSAISNNPLLPILFGKLTGREVNDAQLVDLIQDTFCWEDA